MSDVSESFDPSLAETTRLLNNINEAARKYGQNRGEPQPKKGGGLT